VADLAPLLRRCVQAGDFAPFGEVLADDVVLRSSSEAGRRTVEGAEAIVAHLERPGPGEVLEWEAREWPSGVAVWFEWQGATARDRRRWYVRREGPGGRVAALWSYAARPRGEAAPQVPDAVLRRLGGRRVPLAHAGNSGAALERVVLDGGRTLIAKRVAPGADWLGRATSDRGRTALLHRAGAFDRMPDVIEHGIEEVVADGDGFWVLMRDLSDTFLDAERRLSRAESRRILDAAAALHRTFAGDVPDGAATVEQRVAMSAPRIADAERAGPDLLPKQFETAWEAFVDVADDDVAEAVLKILDDPTPFARALADEGVTLIHGDLRDDNLGFDGERLVLLDWDLAAAGTAAVEFAWYLCHDAWRIDATHDQLEADLRAAEPDLSDRQTDLGLLSGLVQYGWIFGHSARVHPDPHEQEWAREELKWWLPRARRALQSQSF
jgi:hypothetical protein